MVCELLSDRGYNVRAASDGEDAIAHLQSWGGGGCTIVTDLAMPLRDGWSLLQHLSTLPHAERLYRVVVVSASEDLARAGEHPTVSALVRKPFDLARLYAAVEQANGQADAYGE